MFINDLGPVHLYLHLYYFMYFIISLVMHCPCMIWMFCLLEVSIYLTYLYDSCPIYCQNGTMPVGPESSGNCSSFDELIALCSWFMVGQSYSMYNPVLFILYFSVSWPVVNVVLWVSLALCIPVIVLCLAFLPIAGFLVSYMNVHCDVIFVCISLDSLLFPLRLPATTVLIFLLNFYCRPCGERIVLWVPCSFYEIMLTMAILNIVVISLMHYNSHSLFCFLSFFCLQYKLGAYYHYCHGISGAYLQPVFYVTYILNCQLE